MPCFIQSSGGISATQEHRMVCPPNLKTWLRAYVNGWFVQWRWSQSLWQKRLLCSVTVAKWSFFCDKTFCLNRLSTQPTNRPNCLWSVGHQIVSFWTFLTGASTKFKRGHVKPYAVALSVLGASRSRLCPGPRIHLIRPCLQPLHDRPRKKFAMVKNNIYIFCKLSRNQPTGLCFHLYSSLHKGLKIQWLITCVPHCGEYLLS